MPKQRTASHQTHHQHQHHRHDSRTPPSPVDSSDPDGEGEPDIEDSRLSPIPKRAAPKRASSKSNGEAAGTGGSKRERTKDGCLTCRMRRKKCENEKQADGSCLTCHRLRIECYGFGAKRPDWMKDKALVEKKLHEIKEHLVAAGLVRGVAKDKNARKPRSAAAAKAAAQASANGHSTSPVESPTTNQHVPSSGLPSGHANGHVPDGASLPNTYALGQPQTTPVSYPPRPHRPVSPIISHAHTYAHPPPLSLDGGSGIAGTNGIVGEDDLAGMSYLGRDNPHYLVSRAKSRSPVIGHATTVPLSATATGREDDHTHGDENIEVIGSSMGSRNPIGLGYDLTDTSGLGYGMGLIPAFSGPLPHPMSLTMESSTQPLVGPMPLSWYDADQGQNQAQTYSYYPDAQFQQACAQLCEKGVPPSIAASLVHAQFAQQAAFNISSPTSSLSLSTPSSSSSSLSTPSPFFPWLNSYSSSLPPSLAPALPAYMVPQKDGFMYYFDHVATMQYIFDPHSQNTMHSYIRMKPTGVVATAIKMIAAMHDAQHRRASGLPTSGALRTKGTPELLYSEVYKQIMGVLKRDGGRLGEEEATAALHMISYWLFQGGDGRWGEALKIAVHWFQNYGDLYSRNGPRVIRSMTAEQRFAAKTTMWMDIFSAITQCREPYLNGLYKHLLTSCLSGESQAAFSAEDILNSTEPSQPPYNLPRPRSPSDSLFGTTNGCCDAVMCSLAAIVTLEADMANASAMAPLLDADTARLEQAMFTNRATAIREGLEGLILGEKIVELKEEMASSGSGEEYLVDLGDDFPTADGVQGAQQNPASPPESTSSHGSAANGMEFETSDIFRHAALVYLSTLMNGPSPSNPQTVTSVQATYNAILALPSPAVDRSLVFPLCIAGCVTDDPDLRLFFETRLTAMSGPVGNGAKTLELMKLVWERRDRGGEAVGWREVMRESGLEILLV